MRQKSLPSIFRLRISQKLMTTLASTCLFLSFCFQTVAQINVTITYNPPQCAGYGTADATAQVTGGVAPYTYYWSNGNTTQNAFGLNVGSTSVTVTDANGQSANAFTNITAPTELVLNIDGGGDDCYQGNTDLLANVSGGTPPYNFQWSNGQTSALMPNPSNAFYFVTVTDANGCFKVEGKNVAGAMEAIIEMTEVTCFGACDGSIGASVSGGVGPYTYQWDNGMYQSSAIQVIADVGIYNITITDANGCTVVGSEELTQPPLIEATVDLANPCSGTTAASVSATGGVPPYTYKWSNGHFGPNHPYLTEGEHLVVVTDANDCSIEQKIYVSQMDMALTVEMEDADCFGGSTGSALAFVTGGSGTYTYEWSNGKTGANIGDLSPGTYQVTATDIGGCSEEKEFEIISSTGLETAVYPTMVDCFNSGGTANAAVTGGTPPYTFEWNNGQSTQMATDLPAGEYTVQITDIHGCTGEAVVEIEDLNDMEVNLVETTAMLCDATGGTATLEVSGGATPYTYKWNEQWTAEAIGQNLPAGTNTVSIFDVNGCEEVVSFEIMDESMEAVVEVMNAGCPGMSNGIAEAQIMTGGQAPYTFLWSDGSTNAKAQDLNAGWHAVTITDANGCQEMMNVEVPGVEEMVIAVDITPTACAGAETGGALVMIQSGGVAPFTYNWSNDAESEAIGNLGMGQYTLTVTDANGCEQEVMIDVQEEPMEVALNITDPICADEADGAVAVDVIVGGTAPYTYNWSNGMTGASIDNVGPGNYEVMITDANGCEETMAFELAPSTTLAAEFIHGTADCNDNGVLVAFTDMSASASQGTTPNSWSWTFSDGQTSNEQNPQIWVNDANITAELTVTNDLGCTEVMSASVEVEVIDVALASEMSTCHEESFEIELTVNNNANDLVYDWSPNNLILSGDGTPNPVINTAQLGQFELQVSIQNSTGCQKEETVILNIEEVVEINPVSIEHQQCSSLTVDFTNNNNADIECVWYFDYPNNMNASSTEVNPSYTYTQPGDYTVALLPSDNCHEPLLMPVTVTAPPTVAIASETEDCEAEISVQFFNQSDVGNNITGFSWDFGALGTSNDPNPTMTFTEDQIIEATFTMEFNDGCVVAVNETVEVFVFNPPTLDHQWFSCDGKNVDLNPNGDSNFDYRWSAPNNATISSTTVMNPTANISQTTTFEVTITDTDTPNCESIQEVTIEVPPTILSITSLNDVRLCEEGDVILTAEITGDAAIEWSTDPDFNTVMSTETSITVTAGEPTTYYVQAIATDGCAVSTAALVGNFATDVNYDERLEICEGDAFVWEADDIETADIISWQPYNPIGQPATASQIFTFGVDVGAECPAYGTFELVVTPFEFTHSVQASATDLLQGEWSQLEVTSHPDFTYTWAPTNGLSSISIANPSAQPLQTTEYSVHVVDTETGCEGDAKIKINVEDVVCEEPYIFVPNAFTPNDDGVNDKLFVRGFNIDEVYFAVYDRWGEQVFETTDLDQGWDGSFRGTMVSGDVYGYYLKAVCYGGEKFFKKGNVTVLR